MGIKMIKRNLPALQIVEISWQKNSKILAYHKAGFLKIFCQFEVTEDFFWLFLSPGRFPPRLLESKS